MGLWVSLGCLCKSSGTYTMSFLILFRLQELCIILLNKLNTREKFIWHLTKNMDGVAINANKIELQGVKSKF